MAVTQHVLSATTLTQEIDAALTAIKGSMPPSQDREDLFAAIAQGVVKHLLESTDAFTVTVTLAGETATGTVSIHGSAT